MKKIADDPSGDYRLTESQGPWLIMAATFSGEGAEDQARELALEFRSQYNLKAYTHQMSFDFSKDDKGRGIDQHGASIPTRYRRGNVLREHAVLVGEFVSIDDEEGQQMLKRIKTLAPNSLDPEKRGKTTQNLAGLRRLQDIVRKQLGKKTTNGPMGRAFFTRNPLLPKDYFVAHGVDDFVVKMNKGVENSLLDCPGKYSVKVATFRGKIILQTGNGSENKMKRNENQLAKAAQKAHLLTTALRAKGWEAYEFHDRTESLVTVGSFEEAGRTLPDGRVIPTRKIQTIIQTFGASSNAADNPLDPSSSFSNQQNFVQAKRKSDEVRRQFTEKFSKTQGQVATGLSPKHISPLMGVAIPFDIYPHSIEVPKRSVSSAYYQ